MPATTPPMTGDEINTSLGSATHPFVRSHERYPLPEAERRWMARVEEKELHTVIEVLR